MWRSLVLRIRRWLGQTEPARYYLEYSPRKNDRPGLILRGVGIGRSADYGSALQTSIRNAGLTDYNEY